MSAPPVELRETDTTLDRAARAIEDPASVLPRAYRDESMLEWGLRAMYTVLLNLEVRR